MDAKCNMLAHSIINGRNIWLYEIESPIGNLYVVDYEKSPDPAIVRKIWDGAIQKADRYYSDCIQKMAKGRL